MSNSEHSGRYLLNGNNSGKLPLAVSLLILLLNSFLLFLGI